MSINTDMTSWNEGDQGDHRRFFDQHQSETDRLSGFLRFWQKRIKSSRGTVEEVHFHEVGAVDSIVDIVSIAVCLDDLDVTDVVVPVLYDGTGFIRCQHGQIPVPASAVVNVGTGKSSQT